MAAVLACDRFAKTRHVLILLRVQAPDDIVSGIAGSAPFAL
jgi:hypothetical protein